MALNRIFEYSFEDLQFFGYNDRWKFHFIVSVNYNIRGLKADCATFLGFVTVSKL